MPLLLAPVLAQLMTLGVQDRTEARDISLGYQRYEAESTPSASLTLAWKRSSMSLSYGASLRVSPLESPSRKWLVLHTAGLNSSYQFRRTTLSLANNVSYGSVNFQTAALGNPANSTPIPGATDGATTGTDGTAAQPPATDPTQPTPTQPGQPQPGTVQQLRPVDRAVRYVSNVTTINVGHTLSRSVKLSAGASHSYASGLGADSERYYPAIRSLALNGSGSHTTQLSADDSLQLSLAGTDTRSTTGNHASSILGSETWQHAFTRSLSGNLGFGLSVLRIAQDSGLTAYTILPTFLAGFAFGARAAGGNVTFTLGGNLAPVPDQLRATVDPRVSGMTKLAWTRGGFSSTVSGNATTSLARRGNDAGAVDGYAATSSLSYQISKGVAVDCGARLVKQQYQRQAVLPLGYTLFVGLAFGSNWLLNRQR